MNDEDLSHWSPTALLDALVQGNDFTQIEAAKALINQNDTETISPLITLLERAEAQHTRKWAAYILGMMGAPQPQSALIAALRDTQNDLDVRCHAAEALGHLLPTLPQHERESEAVAALHETLAKDEAALRFWAAFALGNVGSEWCVPALQRVAATDDRIVEGWWAVSKEAAEAIQRIQDRKGRELA